MQIRLAYCAFLFYCLCLISCTLSLRNPYEILGVNLKASFVEIKKSYKALARQWHPDKNKDPGAPEKFLEVKQAYELLSDPDRRSLYDKNGITEDSLNSRHTPDYDHFNRFENFERLFAGGFHFKFDSDQGEFYRKQSITKKAFSKFIIPNSSTLPCLILFYTDMCLRCLQAEMVWRRITEEMAPLGIEVATVHANMESALAKQVGVNSLPYLTLVVDGHIYHYKDLQLSLFRTIEFIRNKLPYGLVSTVTADNFVDFLKGWTDNRVRVLMFIRRNVVKLRYLVVAYQFRNQAAFGQVQLGIPENDQLAARYRVSPNDESLLLFNEELDNPIASITSSGSDIPVESMRSLISANRYLLLPRISSQDMFDQLCPPQTSHKKKWLCVVLLSHNIPAHEPYREALRQYLREYPPEAERVRYAYMFADRQTEFAKSLKSDDYQADIGIVVVWRKNQFTLQYKWIPNSWTVDDNYVNVSAEGLSSTIATLLHSNEALSNDAAIKMLVDEHMQNLVTRVLLRMVTFAGYLKENITRYEILPALSVLLTIAFVAAGGYFMSYLMKLEEAAVSEKLQQEPNLTNGSSSKKNADVNLILHELKGATYNGLIRLLKPGCRTIVLLVDSETKATLLPPFYRTCYPYRKNKSLMFAFLNLEKNLEWYRRLLIQTLSEPRELNINPKNCIGTVLSLNGHRRYFCMYHAKYQEPCKTSVSVKRRRGGEFVGFEDSCESSDSEVSDVEAGPKLE
ncbi:hypothetical protein CHUAL_001394 [Chamberlinius hualienensis]